MRVAIVGAGVAGLSCASALTAGGAAVAVFDKGRAPAGRTSTRQAIMPFDHGAQYFTARHPTFQAEVTRLRGEGAVAEWTPRIVAVEQIGGVPRAVPDVVRWVGTPGMNAVARSLAAPLDVHVGVTIAAVERNQHGWQLETNGHGHTGPFDVVVCTAPPAQTATLLGRHPLAATVQTAVMAPCWAVMAAWAEALPVPFDAAFVNDGPLAWIARDGSKPGRPHPHAWVLHASPAWSTDHLEDSSDDVLEAMLEALAAVVGSPLPAPVFSAAHRWRYASVTQGLNLTHLWDGEQGVGVAGDWCDGPRVEGAWLSGRALAHAILGA